MILQITDAENITKTSLFKYIENFTIKNEKKKNR